MRNGRKKKRTEQEKEGEETDGDGREDGRREGGVGRKTGKHNFRAVKEHN